MVGNKTSMTGSLPVMAVFRELEREREREKERERARERVCIESDNKMRLHIKRDKSFGYIVEKKNQFAVGHILSSDTEIKGEVPLPSRSRTLLMMMMMMIQKGIISR